MPFGKKDGGPEGPPPPDAQGHSKPYEDRTCAVGVIDAIRGALAASRRFCAAR